ncbi:MAG TPA: hypothetical protein VLF41_01450, partial [Candidatus Nanoarchaeia archaeon]|nr:hypothetical protein [Candidatus Nanoarchaeia archaeon]
MKYQNERGFVAMITTILVSLMLLLITTGVVAVQANEQRQATDIDKSIKAYYAAVAGAEQAMADIQSGTVAYGASGCNGTSGPVDSSERNIAVTCTQIQKQTSSYSGYLQSEEAYQSPPIPAGAFDSLTIKWHQQGVDPDVVKSTYTGPGGV